jgi:hypothetical protein
MTVDDKLENHGLVRADVRDRRVIEPSPRPLTSLIEDGGRVKPLAKVSINPASGQVDPVRLDVIRVMAGAAMV